MGLPILQLCPELAEDELTAAVCRDIQVEKVKLDEDNRQVAVTCRLPRPLLAGQSLRIRQRLVNVDYQSLRPAPMAPALRTQFARFLHAKETT